MCSIKFSDGTELPVFSIIAGSGYVQGVNRETIQLRIKRDATTFEALDALTASSTNTNKITVISGDDQTVYDNYCIRAELAVRPVVTVAATDTAPEPEQSEEMYCVTLAQLTYLEVQQAEQQAQIDALTLAALGVK